MRLLPEPAPEALSLPSVLHALGDPVRLELVRRASTVSDTTCAVAADGLNVPASTLTNHYRILREAGLLSMTADGRYRRICLRTNDLQDRFPGLLDSVLRLGDAEAATR